METATGGNVALYGNACLKVFLDIFISIVLVADIKNEFSLSLHIKREYGSSEDVRSKNNIDNTKLMMREVIGRVQV